MIIRTLIVDDFLDNFEALREAADSVEFKDEVNPVDKVTYPNIFKGIPEGRAQEIESKLALLVGRAIKVNTMFARLSPRGVHVPHQVHTDTSMGDYSVMIYLNRLEDCRGGTSILRHHAGMESEPRTEAELKLWQRDYNDPMKWQITDHCAMVPNRMFLFRSDLFHRAEPVGGFGRDASDGRLVLTVFFSVLEDAA